MPLASTQVCRHYWQSGHGKYSIIEARCWQLQTRWVIMLQLAMHLQETISARLDHTDVEGRQFPGPCPCPLCSIWPTSDKTQEWESVTSAAAAPVPELPLSPLSLDRTLRRSSRQNVGAWLLVTGYLRSVTAPVSGKPGPSASRGLPSPPLTGDQGQCGECQVPFSSQLPWDPL